MIPAPTRVRVNSRSGFSGVETAPGSAPRLDQPESDDADLHPAETLVEATLDLVPLPD